MDLGHISLDCLTNISLLASLSLSFKLPVSPLALYGLLTNNDTWDSQ